MLSSLNFYYAITGNEAAVLRQRLRACNVRLELGIPRGRVLERTYGSSELPNVVWELSFQDISGHHADMAVRAASAAFEEVREGMRRLCRRFERPLFDVCETMDAVAGAPLPAVVSWDWIFCPPERAGDALHAAQQSAKDSTGRTPTTGRILRLVSGGTDLPAVLWQREYAEGAPDEAAAAILRANCARFGARVEPSLWSEREDVKTEFGR